MMPTTCNYFRDIGAYFNGLWNRMGVSDKEVGLKQKGELKSKLRVRAKINSQILSVEAPAGQGAKAQEYQAYSELSQRRQTGCIGA
jgi:hypothetical protein